MDESCDLDVENEEVLTLQETLEALSLSEYFSTFEKEKIDMESLVLIIVCFTLFEIVFLVYRLKIKNKHFYIKIHSRVDKDWNGLKNWKTQKNIFYNLKGFSKYDAKSRSHQRKQLCNSRHHKQHLKASDTFATHIIDRGLTSLIFKASTSQLQKDHHISVLRK